MPNLLGSCLPMKKNSWIRAVAALGTVLVTVLGALSLSGCASDEMASRILVEPDRYVLYACPELATAWQANMNRQHELEALMIKAGTGTGGQIASSMAYRPEYNQLRGEMVQLRKAAADKNCRAMPSATAPGGATAPARVAPGQ